MSISLDLFFYVDYAIFIVRVVHSIPITGEVLSYFSEDSPRMWGGIPRVFKRYAHSPFKSISFWHLGLNGLWWVFSGFFVGILWVFVGVFRACVGVFRICAILCDLCSFDFGFVKF